MSNVSMKIVAVDDDPAFLTILEIMFRRYKNLPIELSLFSNAEEAIDFIKSESPEIVLLDIFMPKCNGWEVLNRLTQFNVSTHVFMLSSSVDKNDMKKAQEFSLVKEFISKPLTYEKLKSVIQIN